MEKILYGDELYRNENEQTFYSRKENSNNYRLNDLIMINNQRGSYFFSSYDNERGESPVFKIKNRRTRYGQVEFQLQVMQVLYPRPIYHYETERLNTLNAIRDNLAVVKETDTIITFSMNPNYRIEVVRLREIDCVHKLELKENIYGDCDCDYGCKGRVEVKTCDRPDHTHYQFFLTEPAKRGHAEVNQNTGIWNYQSKKAERDSFEITVWNGLGGYATQCIHVKCDKCPCPCPDPKPEPCPKPCPTQKVEVTNTPIPVVSVAPVPVVGSVRVSNEPTVFVANPVEISGLDTSNGYVPVSGLISVSGIIAELSGNPTLNINGPIEVTGTVNLSDDAIVSISGLNLDNGALSVSIIGTPTVLIDQPLGVCVLNPILLDINSVIRVTTPELDGVRQLGDDYGATGRVRVSSDPITISGLDSGSGYLPISGIVSVTGKVDFVDGAAVSISGTPTVAIDQPVEVTGVVDLAAGAVVSISGEPAVTLSGIDTSDGYVPVSGIVTLSGLSNIAGGLPVSVIGIPTISIPDIINVTGTVDLGNVASISVLISTVVVTISPSITVGNTVAVSVVGTPTVLIDQPVAVTGALDLAAGAAVAISGTPSVLIGNALTLSGIPTVAISGAVGISGTPTVLIDQPVAVTGALDLAAGAAVAISGTPSVLIGNALTLSGVPTVAISGAVGISGTPSVSIPGVVTVTGIPQITVNVPTSVTVANAIAISGTPTVISGGRGFTSILLTAFTFAPIAALASFTTPATDISTFNDYTYAIHIQATGLLGALVITPVSQVAPINQPNYFTTDSTGVGISLGIGNTTSNQALTDNFLLQYSRLVLNVPAAVSLGGTIGVTVYLQAQL